MNNRDIVLQKREEHYELIKKYQDYSQVTIKANIPGLPKQIKETYFLVELFYRITNIEALITLFIDDEDGPYYHIVLLKEEPELKIKMMFIENTHPLGRFIDLDVFIPAERLIRSLNRNKNDLRNCYLCDTPAFICMHLQTHSIFDLRNYFITQITDYLFTTIEKAIYDSMMIELDLNPKFGLVTPYTNGSHSDMNYYLMKESIKTITPYILMMAKKGYELTDLTELFKSIREIGLSAEEAMFNTTNGINTYKGLIFGLGLLVSSFTFYLGHHQKQEAIFDNIRIMTKDLNKEYHTLSSTGITFWHQYQFKGARENAMLGYPLVKKYYQIPFDYHKDKDVLLILIRLIQENDDTVLLKRVGNLEDYQEIINRFINLNINDEQAINQLSTYCINKGLSFGGSADLLIMIIYLKIMKEKKLIS